MSLWLEAFERVWSMALVTVPVALPIVLVQFFSARKTRRLNTQEHGANAAHFKEAADNARAAALWSKRASRDARRAVTKVAAVDGRLTGFIEAHKQVHEDLRR